MYIVVRGGVELSGVAGQSLVARENTPFGTWSLIDSDPSLVKAKVLEPTRLLRVTRSDFLELLEDHPGLATGILQALARRMRSFVAS
jgi:CRP-like cAMP-binding protein